MRNVFLYSSALLFFSLPYHTAVKYIAMVLVFLSGVFIIIKEKSFKMDLLNLILLGFGIETLISGVLHTGELKKFLYIEKDLWIIISGFILYRSISLTKDEIIKFVIIPLIVSSIVLFFCGLYKYYILHDYYKYHLFTNVNRSAIYAVLTLSFILPFIDIIKEYKIKSIFIIGIIFILITLMFLASRNAMITMIIILMLYFIYFSKAGLKFKLILMFIGVISFIFIYFNYGWLVFKIHMLTHLPYRWDIWKAGIDSYIESGNYLLGIGTNNFRSIDLTPYISNWQTHIGSGHNLFIEILVENGILGLGLYLTFLILIIMKLKNCKNKNDVFFKTAVLLVVTHLLTSMTETSLMKEHGFLFLAFVGMSIRGIEKDKEKCLT